MLYTIRLMNYPKNLSGERVGRGSNSTSTKVSFIKNGNGLYRLDYSSYTVLSVKEFWRTVSAEKRLAEYGTTYIFERKSV